MASSEGLVISDLHLMSDRSDGEVLFREQIEPQLSEIDTLVLNGDIFDFRWAGVSLTESIQWSIRWMNELVVRFPQLDIRYVLGNHDCHTEFVEELEKISAVRVYPHYLVLGRCLFIHGDAANCFMDQAKFDQFRRFWEKDQPRGKFSMQIYQLIDSLKIAELGHSIYFYGDTAAKRIGRHLDAIKPGWRGEIDHCYFGHTHKPIEAVVIDQVAFHNTGSAIRGMGFQPFSFQY